MSTYTYKYIYKYTCTYMYIYISSSHTHTHTHLSNNSKKPSQKNTGASTIFWPYQLPVFLLWPRQRNPRPWPFLSVFFSGCFVKVIAWGFHENVGARGWSLWDRIQQTKWNVMKNHLQIKCVFNSGSLRLQYLEVSLGSYDVSYYKILSWPFTKTCIWHTIRTAAQVWDLTRKTPWVLLVSYI